MSTDERKHVVYRAFDANGQCLYVGVTAQLQRRTATHERESRWYPLAVRRTLTGPMDRASAYALEAREIIRLRPTHNRYGQVEVIDRQGLIDNRKRAGYTQVTLAAEVGCTQQYLSLLERGIDTDCSASLARKIADRLGIGPEAEVFSALPTPA